MKNCNTYSTVCASLLFLVALMVVAISQPHKPEGCTLPPTFKAFDVVSTPNGIGIVCDVEPERVYPSHGCMELIYCVQYDDVCRKVNSKDMTLCQSGKSTELSSSSKDDSQPSSSTEDGS